MLFKKLDINWSVAVQYSYTFVIQILLGIKMAKHLMAVRLSLDLEQSLAFCAKELHRPKSQLVNEALSIYLEDVQDYISAKKVLELNEPTFSLDEVERELDL